MKVSTPRFVWGGVLILMTQFACAFEPPEEQTFTRVDLKTANLTPKQEKILGRIASGKATMAVEVVKFDKKRLSPTSQPLHIPLPNQEELSLNRFVLKDETDGVNLKGDTGNPDDVTSIFITADSVNGLMYVGSKVYSIEPLGGGLQAVCLLNQSRFPDEPPKEQKAVEKD